MPKITKDGRTGYRNVLMVDIVREGIKVTKKNTVYFETYDTLDNEFIDIMQKAF